MIEDGDRPCNLCGSQTNLERVRIKRMLSEWEKESPNRVVSIFKSMQRVTTSHMLDPALYDFAGLTPGREAEGGELDIAFDTAPIKKTGTVTIFHTGSKGPADLD